MSSSNSPKIALVTGGNKGIGLGLVKALAALPDTHVILTARDVERGQEAVKSVAAERNNVEFMQMDVTEEKSIARVAAEIKEKYSGLDILMNNAGVAAKGDAFDGDIAQWTLGTNYFGALSVLNHFVPLMQDRPQPRVVNVSSMVSQSALGNCSKELQQKFLAEDLTVEQLSDLMRQFIRDVSDNTYASKGWPKSAYGISKVGVSQLTRILARDNKNPNLLINACCPGWVRTDMAGPRAQLSVDEGVVTPMKVATLPPGSPSGKLWRHENVAAWM